LDVLVAEFLLVDFSSDIWLSCKFGNLLDATIARSLGIIFFGSNVMPIPALTAAIIPE